MVQSVSHIKIARGIERHSPRIAELSWLGPCHANDFDRLVVRIEDLDAAIAEFANVLASGAVHANVIRIAQLAFAGAGLSISSKEFAVAGKNLNAVIARIGDVQTVMSIDAKSFGPIELTRSRPGLAEASEEFDRKIFALIGKLKFLDAFNFAVFADKYFPA